MMLFPPPKSFQTFALHAAMGLILLIAMGAAPVAATSTAPLTAPAALPPRPAKTQASANPATAPATDTATAPAATAETNKFHLDENPNLRIWGVFSPRQMLHLGITAIVIFNVIGWPLLLWAIYRTKQ